MPRKAITLVLCASLCAGLSTAANARDFGFERFADMLATVYGGSFGVLVPFTEMPDPASDTAHRGEGYPGSIWNFVVTRGRSGGTIYSHADVYCNPDVVPAPIIAGTTRISNYLYRTEISATGDFTVTGASDQDVIFKLSAIDAKYITSYAFDIKNARRYYIPFNDLKTATTQARAKCGPDYAYGLKSVIVGDVTIKVYFIAGVSTQLAANIGTHIKLNLGLKAEGKLGDSETNPVVIFSEGDKAFAIATQPLPIR